MVSLGKRFLKIPYEMLFLFEIIPLLPVGMRLIFNQKSAGGMALTVLSSCAALGERY